MSAGYNYFFFRKTLLQREHRVKPSLLNCRVTVVIILCQILGVLQLYCKNNIAF